MTGWGNVLISPKHQPFAAAATFDIRSRIPIQTAVAATAAAAACATRSCHAARKNKLDFRPSKTPSVFAAARCLTNVFFGFLPHPSDILLFFPAIRRRRARCILIPCHISVKLFFNHTSVDVAGCSWNYYWANYIVDIDVDLEKSIDILIVGTQTDRSRF